MYNKTDLLALRRDIHKNPELAFEEIETSKKIVAFLNSLGIQDKSIKKVAKTGLIVDIPGKGQPQGDKQCIALRADMDALPMSVSLPVLIAHDALVLHNLTLFVL